MLRRTTRVRVCLCVPVPHLAAARHFTHLNTARLSLDMYGKSHLVSELDCFIYLFIFLASVQRGGPAGKQAHTGGGVPVGRPSLVWLRPRVDRGSATLAPLAAVAAVAAADFGLRGCRVKRV